MYDTRALEGKGSVPGWEWEWDVGILFSFSLTGKGQKVAASAFCCEAKKKGTIICTTESYYTRREG